MKISLFVLLCTAISSVSGGNVRVEFRKAMAKFAEKDHINLAEGVRTRTARFQSFVKFHARVEEINNDDSRLFTAEDNFLSILTEEERKGRLGFNITEAMEENKEELEEREDSSDKDVLPEHRDFSHIISDIKDQGDCGSCWTFSATGSLEGEIFFKTGHRKVNLAEREFLECATHKNGCQGGYQKWCFTYAKKKGRIAPTSAYSYKGYDRGCSVEQGTPNALEEHNVKVTGMLKIPNGKLKKYASRHIVSVAVYTGSDFMAYSGGVYMDNFCQQRPNHAVVLVGYGERMGRKYWKIRNSWGADWGEQGYILMDREKSNICKIDNFAYIPIVECRDDSCVAHHPDEGDSGKEEFTTEESGDVCYRTKNFGGCNKAQEGAKKACVESGISEDQCWVYKENKNCYIGTIAGQAVNGRKVEMAFSCDETDDTIDDGSDGSFCRDKFGLSECKASKEAAIKICRLSGVPANKCMIVKKNESCYKSSLAGSSTGGTLERTPRCWEEEEEQWEWDGEVVTEEPPPIDCSLKYAAGVVYCPSCHCCRHKYFCPDFQNE